MKIEDKQLLVNALYALLPYNVKVQYKEKNFEIDYVSLFDEVKLNTPDNYTVPAYEIIPYLRPMSKMTDEEKAQVQTFMDIVTDENYGDGYSPSAWDAMNGFVQYCDSHYLDHRGLIFRGIALEAPEGMY
ncbi:MAG: hypothetical protein IKO56_02325 [Alphaproteobacteria bacterium]|nr:hypothetical protein [Alphaproteobacteria bacterium]